MQTYSEEDQMCLYDPDLWCGKTSPEPSPAGNRRGRTSGLSSRKLFELSSIPYQFLDLTPGAGNLLGVFYWEILSPWRGESLTLNTGASPRDAVVSTLWQILEDKPHPKYYLTRKACLGILRRSSERDKPLPTALRSALEIQAGLWEDASLIEEKTAFAANQRDEVWNLHDIAGALGAQPGMKQQTFIASGVVTKGNGYCFMTENVHTALSAGGGQAGQGYPCVFTAGFCAEASKSARGIGYQEECAPTLKAVEKGPSVMCLNDQGGQVMDCTENITGTLRAQMHSHQPLILESNQEHARVRTDGISPTLPASMGMGGGYVPMVYENHGIDARYSGPHEVSPTISARCGTGGNNVPLVEEPPTAFCISGNIVDRNPHNGGNGLGINEDVAFSLTTADRHAVFSRQRVDVFAENEVASTESARQQKDATDLVIQPPADEEETCILRGANLIRRLMPLECERLQGFPDGWTNIPGTSDSARYKALGNSVAIPCVEYVMRGIAIILRSEHRRRVWIVIFIVAVESTSAGI